MLSHFKFLHHKGSSHVKHACLRWRQRLRLFYLKPKAVFQQHNYSVWNSQTKSFKSCSVHDLPEWKHFLSNHFFENTCFQTAVSRFAFPHRRMSAVDTGLRRNWVQTLVLTREQTFYVSVKVEEKLNALLIVYILSIMRWSGGPSNVWLPHYWTIRLDPNRYRKVTLRF